MGFVNRAAKYFDAGTSGSPQVAVFTLPFTPTTGNRLVVLSFNLGDAVMTDVRDNSTGTPSYVERVEGTKANAGDSGIWDRVVGASVPTTITLEFAGSCLPFLVVYELSNVDSGSPIIESVANWPFSPEGFGQSHTFPYTAVAAGDMFVGIGDCGGGQVAVAVAGTTVSYDPATPALYNIGPGIDKVAAGAGAGTAGVTTAADNNVKRMTALYRFSAGGGGGNAPRAAYQYRRWRAA